MEEGRRHLPAGEEGLVSAPLGSRAAGSPRDECFLLHGAGRLGMEEEFCPLFSFPNVFYLFLYSILFCVSFRGTAWWVANHVFHKVVPLILPVPT